MSGQSSVSNGSDDARSSITSNENDNSSSSSIHPSEPVIQFHESSTRSSTSPTPSSTNSPPASHQSSEDNTNYPSPTSIYHQQQTHPYVPGAAEQRRYPFLFTTHQPVYFAESEKLRKLRQKKERRENRKDKNVKETFQTPKSDEAYNFEAVLEALGEPKEDKKQKKVKANNVNNGSNDKQKGRRRSNGKSDEKVRTEDEDENEPAENEDADEGSKDTQLVNDVTPLLNNQRNYVLVPLEPEPGDLRRQTSKSTENLTSFTQVKKRPRGKKKSPSSDDNNVHYGKSQSFDGKRMNGGGTPDKTFDNQNPDTPSEDSSVAGEPIQLAQQPTQNQHEEEEGQATDLNFSTDFPPLGDRTESESLSAVWPVKPSSDPAAVIDNSSSDTSNIASPCPGTPTPTCAILSGPPDITVQGSGVASQSLPDIATQAPLLYNNDSGESTPPLSTTDEKASDQTFVAKPNTAASFYIDDNNVEIVLTEEEYNNRKDSNQGAAVVILGQGELKDWCTSSGLTFGFDINEELVSATDTFSQLPNGETITFEGEVNEKFDFAGTFMQANKSDPKDRNPYILSPESGISSSSPVSWKAAVEAPSPQNPNVAVPRNGEEVWSPSSSPIHWTGVAGPQVQIVQSPDEEWADQEDNTTPTPPEPQAVNDANKDQDNIVFYDKAPVSHNHLEIISVLSAGWKQVERDIKMKPNDVQYYTPVKV